MTSLEPFGKGLWLAEGPMVTAAMGFRYPTRMAVIRLQDGGLFIWSPVALAPDLAAQVRALGPVRHIVAPNALHDTFLAQWAAAYPEAALHAAPGLAGQRPDLSFSSTLSEGPPEAWADVIDQVVVGGNAITTEVVFFHRESGTVLFADLIQQFPRSWFRGWRSILARLDLMTGPEPAVPRKFRMAFTDRKLARRAVSRILDWPAGQVVMAHGTPVRRDGAAFLRRAFRWLRVARG